VLGRRLLGSQKRRTTQFLVAGGILRRRLELDISRTSLLNGPVGLLLHAPKRQHPGAYPPCPVGIPADLREGGCEGEGEKFLMGINDGMPCRPRTASLRACWRCLIRLHSICSEASDRRSGAIRDASIGTKESVSFHSQLGLARDCQRAR
jgi:hypothetical protein